MIGRANRRGARGFTLLELMIVISILVILALIAMGQYNRTVLAAKSQRGAQTSSRCEDDRPVRREKGKLPHRSRPPQRR